MVSLPTAYFDDMYADNADPWGFTHRWYERRKAALTMAALPRRRYDAALELGCSIGVLTESLSRRCDLVLALDAAERAVRLCRERVAGRSGVTVRHRRIPEQWPAGEWDLIVFSELGYYLGAEDLDLTIQRAVSSLRPGGDLLAVHWRHQIAGCDFGGDDVHRLVAEVPCLERTVEHVEADFRLEVFARTPPSAMSVAERSGLV